MADGSVGEYAGASLPPPPMSADEFAARAIDLGVGTAALIFALPLFVALALATWVVDPGPVLHAHMRVGRGGREFPCWKFRSMAVDSEARLQAFLATSPSARWEWAHFHKLRHDPRVTPLGRVLRASKLDELPQLLNVLRGDMSLVGPRPIVTAEIPHYRRYYADYCSVRPGLTGLWQVAGRGRVSYRRRVAMDVLYVRRRSVWLNLKILAMTVPAVLLRPVEG